MATDMVCPHCNSTKNGVVDVRPTKDKIGVRRRRRCLNCEKRFSTMEKTIAKKTDRIIHRAITKGSGGGYSWLKLCDLKKTVKHGGDLSWENKKVTCLECRKIIKLSDLDKER